MNWSVKHLGSLQLQRRIYGADDLAGATVRACCLVDLDFAIRNCQRSCYGADVDSVVASFGAFRLIYADVALECFAHLYGSWRAFEFACSACWALVFGDVDCNLHVFSLAGAKDVNVFDGVSIIGNFCNCDLLEWAGLNACVTVFGAHLGVDLDVPNECREAFFVDDVEIVAACRYFDCSVGAGYVADAAKVAFCEVDVDFSLLGSFARCLRLLG